MQPQLHHCCKSSGLSYTAWHMNSQRPFKKKEVLKGNTSNLRKTDPITVKPVVSAEGAPCQTSQTGLVHQACIIEEGCSPQARWQWTEVHPHKDFYYIVYLNKLVDFYFNNWEISLQMIYVFLHKLFFLVCIHA
jgi:hypothetical protein